jgi:predicted AAA+ superfamily ATPase
MAVSYRDRVGKALEALGPALGLWVDRRMTRRTPAGGHWKAAYGTENLESDPSALIAVVFDHYADVFKPEIGSHGRSLLDLVRKARNDHAHNQPFTLDTAYKALDRIEEFLVLIDAPQAEEVGAAKTELMRARVEAEAKRATPKPEALFAEPAGGLKPWRDVVSPHDDVARGRYNVAEFAANLFQVAAGKGLAEYTEPVEFFRRTYLTAGLRTLLTQASQRITGTGGAPVVDLQTNFGGGKTHSMIALWHMCSGLGVTSFPQEVQELLGAAGVASLPAVRRAVIVGTQMSPGQADVKPDGTVVNTLWGEIAWQLGGADAYALVADADRTATNPGRAMEDVLTVCGPCLILIDEWVAYARQLVDPREVLPGGSFETQFSFAQTLADATIATPGSLLVVSLPVSDDPARPGAEPIGSEAEVGGAAGIEAARRLGNVIGRTETSWRPASAQESFEIVRRRLFQPVPTDHLKHRDATARAFGEFYRSQAAEFPSEAREPAYVEAIKGAYPVHPELFARLYEDWSTLEGFQRTRGVLRLMAAVISALWSAGDRSPLILPANLPLDDPAVQAELTRNLDHAWQPILDTDIDGPASVPRKVDTDFPNLGRYAAARRAARTVFLATAPQGSGTANRGIEMQRVKLGCAAPGESVAIYGDALGRLSDRSSFLYAQGVRYWYGTQASVARLARDLVDQLLATRRDEVHAHIRTRLDAACRERGDFIGVHVCPGAPGEVPDDADSRLVVLAPSSPHVNRDDASKAMASARALLEQRGSGARLYRNMVVFLAPDLKRLEELERGVAEFLAWSDIHGRWKQLGLDAFQLDQAEQRRRDAERAVEARVAETYHWLLVPHQPDPTGPIQWETVKADGQGALAVRASRKLVNAGALQLAYSPELLRSALGDGGLLASMWADGHVAVSALWDAFARYPYLPRLQRMTVLAETVRRGSASIGWEQHGFAVAEAHDPTTGRYAGLVTGSLAASAIGTTLVVRPDRALAQLAADSTEPPPAGRQGAGTQPGREPSIDGRPPRPPADTGPKRFYAVARLDPERSQRDYGKLATEIIANLAGHFGTEVQITVEITAANPAGFTDHVIRTVTENAQTLKVETHGFEAT